jgi:hypothetical protein
MKKIKRLKVKPFRIKKTARKLLRRWARRQVREDIEQSFVRSAR